MHVFKLVQQAVCQRSHPQDHSQFLSTVPLSNELGMTRCQGREVKRSLCNQFRGSWEGDEEARESRLTGPEAKSQIGDNLYINTSKF